MWWEQRSTSSTHHYLPSETFTLADYTRRPLVLWRAHSTRTSPVHIAALREETRTHQTGANRQINSVYPLKQPGSWPFLSCLISPGLRHNNPTPSERKKKKATTVSCKMPPRFIWVYCIVCAFALSPISIWHCVHWHPKEALPHSVCVCVLVYFWAFSTSKAKLCYFVLLFFNTMTVKFYTIQFFNRQIWKGIYHNLEPLDHC